MSRNLGFSTTIDPPTIDPPNKRKETYTRLFTQLKAWLEPVATLQFSHFLVDFEQGAYLTLVDVFPGVEVEGCFFHLCQRLDYHVKELGLMTKYENDPDFKLRVKKLAALAFLPLADVIDAFEVLADTFEDDELLLLGYFEPTWIVVTVGRRSGRRTAPIFPFGMWNVHGHHFTGTTRTTNALEAFHHVNCRGVNCRGVNCRGVNCRGVNCRPPVITALQNAVNTLAAEGLTALQIP